MSRNMVIGLVAVVVVAGGAWYLSGKNVADDADSSAAAGRAVKSAATVAYTDTGFSPARVDVHLGEAVTFLNKSSKAMRVMTTSVPTIPGQPNPGFDQGISVGKEESFTYLFNNAGEWKYQNLANTAHTGVVIVK